MADLVLFYVFAALAIGASVLVIAQRSPIYSVLLLIASFVALAGLYVLLDAPFLAVIQIIIYAGAIMVLFLFVVMLLNAPYETPAEAKSAPVQHKRRMRRLGAAIGLVLVVELVWTLWRTIGTHDARTALAANQTAEAVSSVREIGRVLYTDYAFAFEVTSVLILVAMVGAVVLAKREI